MSIFNNGNICPTQLCFSTEITFRNTESCGSTITRTIFANPHGTTEEFVATVKKAVAEYAPTADVTQIILEKKPLLPLTSEYQQLPLSTYLTTSNRHLLLTVYVRNSQSSN